MKTRFAKPFEGVQVKIPYETGMNPYSGLLDLFEKKGLITQAGNRLKYITAEGQELLDYRKNWGEQNLEIVMREVSNPVVMNEHATPEINLQEEEAIQKLQDGDTDAN